MRDAPESPQFGQWVCVIVDADVEARKGIGRPDPDRTGLAPPLVAASPLSGLERNIGVPTRWRHLPGYDSSEIYELSG